MRIGKIPTMGSCDGDYDVIEAGGKAFDVRKFHKKIREDEVLNGVNKAGKGAREAGMGREDL